ncbi:MAG: ABC transporter ATP-binding protein [Euryarchaeota archaeon]|nr:ABC transporter ATP-binding protein [Euryarchaeota archaeon]MDE1836054.1 ABC transporter ATP-binding protein [Euryarchaeota archaeon]MDE1879998.1 ABC transporter ATP-binding protein [Euryarchaeota archaeon]MDE2044032.1 ABC transporter ATP-binding protein [Thermoplasmata archaeon]
MSAPSATTTTREAPVAFLRGVAKTYGEGASEVHALRGVDLTVRSGEFVAIMGPSGSGKSTLLHILGCMDVPTEGEVEIDGVPVPRQSDSERTRLRSERIGFVFQQFHLLRDLTVRENLELPQVYLRRREGKHLPTPEQLIRRVRLPAALLDRHPTQISGGEAQRVAIARALANAPSLLLGDEPTGNLDTVNSSAVMRIFDQLSREGATIVLVTHNPEVAEHAQRVVRVGDGRIVREERPPHPSGQEGSG